MLTGLYHYLWSLRLYAELIEMYNIYGGTFLSLLPIVRERNTKE